jgi:hypothetical protein
VKPAKPEHCKGCTSFHNAGRGNPVGGLEKRNAWCCAKGAPAKESVGWCKLNNKKGVSGDT